MAKSKYAKVMAGPISLADCCQIRRTHVGINPVREQLGFSPWRSGRSAMACKPLAFLKHQLNLEAVPGPPMYARLAWRMTASVWPAWLPHPPAAGVLSFHSLRRPISCRVPSTRAYPLLLTLFYERPLKLLSNLCYFVQTKPRSYSACRHSLPASFPTSCQVPRLLELDQRVIGLARKASVVPAKSAWQGTTSFEFFPAINLEP